MGVFPHSQLLYSPTPPAYSPTTIFFVPIFLARTHTGTSCSHRTLSSLGSDPPTCICISAISPFKLVSSIFLLFFLAKRSGLSWFSVASLYRQAFSCLPCKNLSRPIPQYCSLNRVFRVRPCHDLFLLKFHPFRFVKNGEDPFLLF